VKDKFSMGLGLLLAASLLVAVLGVPFR
jgi:hypothetical protein